MSSIYLGFVPCIISSWNSGGFSNPIYLFCAITDCLFTFVEPSITQSLVLFFSKRHSLHIQPFSPFVLSFTSPHSSLRAVTRNTSSPRIHNLTSPQHFGQSRCASTGLVNHTRFLKRNVLSVKAPTGQTSITFPIKSLSRFFSMNVAICE